MSGLTDVGESQKAMQLPPAFARPGAWRRLWPAYCIGIGIVLILVGVLA